MRKTLFLLLIWKIVLLRIWVEILLVQEQIVYLLIRAECHTIIFQHGAVFLLLILEKWVLILLGLLLNRTALLAFHFCQYYKSLVIIFN